MCAVLLRKMCTTMVTVVLWASTASSQKIMILFCASHCGDQSSIYHGTSGPVLVQTLQPSGNFFTGHTTNFAARSPVTDRGMCQSGHMRLNDLHLPVGVFLTVSTELMPAVVPDP